jgi:hypothetical protein
MNILKTLNFDKHKIELFLMCVIVLLYYKKIEDKKNCIMETHGPFVKIMLLMKLLNILCSNQTLILEDFFIHLNFFNIHIIH